MKNIDLNKFKTLNRDDLMRTEQFTPNYIELGFRQEDINDLIEIALDKELKFFNSTDEKEIYYPCHAIQILGQLKTLEPFDALIGRIDDFADDDYYTSAVAYYLRKVGLAKIDVLYAYFLDRAKDIFNRMLIVEVLEDIFGQDSSIEEELEKVLVTYLKREDELDDGLNAFVIFLLVYVSEDKYIELIRHVFEHKPVDVFYDGDLEDIEIRLGLRDERETPKPSLFDFVKDNKSDFGSESIDMLSPWIQTKPKIGRNDPCPCGSGKKHKKCCLNK